MSESEEQHLTEGVLASAEWGFPLSTFDLRMIAKSYLDKKGVMKENLKNNLPGTDWARNFLKRHKKILSVRLANNIKEVLVVRDLSVRKLIFQA